MGTSWGVHPDGDPKGLVILQEGFAPFARTEEEERRAEEALAARVAAEGDGTPTRE